MGFALNVQGFGEKTGIAMDQVVQKAGFGLFKDLVMETPVDTGLAQSNYFPSIECDTASVEAMAVPGGDPSLARAAAFFPTLKAGGSFYITNNLPYILPITQYGHSKQMASGGITTLVATWQERVDQAVATL